MVFATPRSWVRVSDILNFDPDVTKPVIRHKIIGNVGEVEGNQFVEYCKSHSDFVTADAFLNGQKEPNSPEEMSILVNALVRKVSFLEDLGSDMPSAEQREQVEKVIRAFFRFSKAEFTVLGLQGLLELNREAVKQVFFQMDDANISNFIAKNSYALGLENGGKNPNNSPLAVWR